MITFIICVKHYENCHSYDNTWELLKNTLASVCNQTDKNFDVIVVSNKTLDDFADNPKIKNVKFIEVDWKPPATSDNWQIKVQTTDENGMNQIRIDRGAKYILGLFTAAKTKKENHYVMFVDADDFIHKDLGKYVNNNDKDLYKVQLGYKLGNSNTYENMNNFVGICGTSNITKIKLLTDHLSFAGIDINSSQHKIIKTTDDYYLKMIIGSHRWSYDFFAKKGWKGGSIPFRAAIYNCTHSEQHSGKGNREELKKLSKDMVGDFSIKTLEILS